MNLGAVATGINSAVQGGVEGYNLGVAAQERKRRTDIENRLTTAAEQRSAASSGAMNAKNLYLMSLGEIDRTKRRMTMLMDQDPKGENQDIKNQVKALNDHLNVLYQGRDQSFSQISDPFGGGFYDDYMPLMRGDQTAGPSINAPSGGLP